MMQRDRILYSSIALLLFTACGGGDSNNNSGERVDDNVSSLVEEHQAIEQKLISVEREIEEKRGLKIVFDPIISTKISSKNSKSEIFKETVSPELTGVVGVDHFDITGDAYSLNIQSEDINKSILLTVGSSEIEAVDDENASRVFVSANGPNVDLSGFDTIVNIDSNATVEDIADEIIARLEGIGASVVTRNEDPSAIVFADNNKTITGYHTPENNISLTCTDEAGEIDPLSTILADGNVTLPSLSQDSDMSCVGDKGTELASYRVVDIDTPDLLKQYQVPDFVIPYEDADSNIAISFEDLKTPASADVATGLKTKLAEKNVLGGVDVDDANVSISYTIEVDGESVPFFQGKTIVLGAGEYPLTAEMKLGDEVIKSTRVSDVKVTQEEAPYIAPVATPTPEVVNQPTDFSGLSTFEAGPTKGLQGEITDPEGVASVDIDFSDGSHSSYPDGVLDNEGTHAIGTTYTITATDGTGKVTTKTGTFE